MTQQEKADSFHALHKGPGILLLPNAWDVASARIFELAGFPAIATTSAGVAATLGYPDGQSIPRDEMLAFVSRIVSAVAVPVSADMEAGYGDPVGIAEAVADAGAVGLNLEDYVPDRPGQVTDLATQTAIIKQICGLRLPLVVNARTDIYLESIGDPSTRFAATVQRLNAFRDAGAHSLFAPGLNDSSTIAALVREIRGPLNILANPAAPPPIELERLGVARLSIGSGASRAALGLARKIALQLKEKTSYSAMFDGAIPYAEVNSMFSSRAHSKEPGI